MNDMIAYLDALEEATERPIDELKLCLDGWHELDRSINDMLQTILKAPSGGKL